MSDIKWLPYSIPISIALVLELAIAPGTALPAIPQFSASRFSAQRFPLAPLKKGEEAFLTRLVEEGWGDQAERYPIVSSTATELQGSEKPPISNFNGGKLAQRNPPPPPKNPGSSAAGGRRNPSACPQDAISAERNSGGTAATTSPALTALSPITKPALTLAERPTFLVYVPKTSAKTAEFSLRNRNGSGVYRTTIALTNTPDIISITLPAQAMPLEIGKQYTWSLAIICNPNDRVEDQFVTGMVQRTELDPTRSRQIQQAPLKDRVLLYQKADVWYDALATLFELRRAEPNDSSISTAWREFLQSGGVDALTEGNLDK